MSCFLVNMLCKIVILCSFVLCSCGEGDFKMVFDLAEGSSCSWNGLEGKCTNINNCPSAQDALRRKSHPLICSFEGKTPIVCCTICKLPQSTIVGKRESYTGCLAPSLTHTGTRLKQSYFERENVGKRESYTGCLTPSLTHTETRFKQSYFECEKDPIKDFGIDSRFNRTSKARDNCLKYLQTLAFPCGVILLRPIEARSASDKNCSDNDAPLPLENARNRRSSKDFNIKLLPFEVNQSDTFYPARGAPAISHGQAAYRRQYPHMALLGYGDDLKTAQWLCGGSVISEKFILTAAHCISSPAVGTVKFIALGILNRSDPPELWQTHNVKRIIGHPGYQPPSKYNDIALLETEDTISFNNDVLPACLPLVPEANERATATGWGALGHRRGLADTLQTVNLVMYDAEKCSQLYPKHRHLREGYNHTTQMCYGDTQEAKDTCEGDSGGPLQTSNEFAWCAYTLLGVTSYGRQCGISAGSGMYTRVYHYVPWIESLVWP